MKNKRNLRERILDLLFPSKCMFCKREIRPTSDYKACDKCIASLPYTKNNGCFETAGYATYLISPLHYSKGVKNAIRDLKFNAKYENAALLSQLMISYIRNINEAKRADVIINVPLSPKKLLERGFNQTDLLAKPIAEAFGIFHMKDALKKIRETARQSSFSTLAERTQNIKDAFHCDSDLTGKTVLLVDDVYTSGMTIYHCAKELIACGAIKVIAVTAATAHKDIGISLHDYKAAHILFENSTKKQEAMAK